MSYIRAEDILPPDVLLLVQSYVEGRLLYIPKKRIARNKWGSVSGSKTYYSRRNALICAEFRQGACVYDLMTKYCLSEKSIQRILRSSSRKGVGKKEKHESREQKEDV